ncbi:MAG: hypothetical protein L6Q76_08360 [Polyangiaceae bacterium]|nr:hypothetical protein [Polyangiaceae bacterium]
MSLRSALARALPSAFAIAFGLSHLGMSCGQSALGILPGVVNDPANLSLRKAILSYATNQVCAEMLRRSIPLKLRDDDPATGRFYATNCYTQEMSTQNLFIQFGGYGYAWTNLTKRLGFDASTAVEYEHDFQMDGSTMYVYFKQRTTTAAQLTARFVEQQQPAVGAVAIPVGMSNDTFVNTFGPQILKNEVARGFTVIRDPDGTVQFGLGMVPKGQKPPVPYKISPSGREIVANDRSEIHQNQRDYVGPIEIKEDDQALYLTSAVDGAPGADVLVVPKQLGDTWLEQYTRNAALTPPPAPPALDEQIFAGVIWRKTIALPKGYYYLVLDNSASAGRTAPPNVPGDDRAALVSFAIELGDAP